MAARAAWLGGVRGRGCAAPEGIKALRLCGIAFRPRVQDELHFDAAHCLEGVTDLEVEAAEVCRDAGGELRVRWIVGCLRAEGRVCALGHVATSEKCGCNGRVAECIFP